MRSVGWLGGIDFTILDPYGALDRATEGIRARSGDATPGWDAAVLSVPVRSLATISAGDDPVCASPSIAPLLVQGHSRPASINGGAHFSRGAGHHRAGSLREIEQTQSLELLFWRTNSAQGRTKRCFHLCQLLWTLLRQVDQLI